MVLMIRSLRSRSRGSRRRRAAPGLRRTRRARIGGTGGRSGLGRNTRCGELGIFPVAERHGRAPLHQLADLPGAAAVPSSGVHRPPPQESPGRSNRVDCPLPRGGGNVLRRASVSPYIRNRRAAGWAWRNARTGVGRQRPPALGQHPEVGERCLPKLVHGQEAQPQGGHGREDRHPARTQRLDDLPGERRSLYHQRRRRGHGTASWLMP